MFSNCAVVNTGAPQGILSPLLYSLFTHDGLIRGSDESVCQGQVDNLVKWCSLINFELNNTGRCVKKAK